MKNIGWPIMYGIKIMNTTCNFEVDQQFLIKRIKEYLDEHIEFIEGILMLDGPTVVYICNKQREQIAFEEFDVFKDYDIKYIWFDNVLFSIEDLEDYKIFTKSKK